MSYLKSVFSLIVLFIFFSLNLSAQLTAVDEGCAPITIQFNAPAGATNFSWDFGDGNNSTDQNPPNNYLNPGTYVISFTDGANTVTDTVFIYNKPTVNFEADTLIGCQPFEVNFTNTSSIDPGVIITNYNWDFGDLTAIGNGVDVSHVYNKADTFTVSLELLSSSMPSCESFGEKKDYIIVNALPDVVISADVTSACIAPLVVTFTNGTENLPNYTYQWDFGNGETLAGRDPISPITYTDVGTYNATLTVTDDLGCSSDSTIVISVGGPNVDIIIGDTICASPIPQLVRNGSSNGDYFWEFSSPAVPRISNLRQPNVRFPDEGNYTIILTVTDPDEGCTSSDTIMVYAEIPSTDFTVDPSYTCEYPVDLVYTPVATDIIALNWIIYDASLDSTYLTNDSIATYGILRDTSTYGLNGLREIETTLRITNSRGCLAFETKKDTVFAPNARFNTDTIMGCAPLEVTFYDSMSVSRETITSFVYEWGDGSPNSTFTTNDSVKHTFMQAGEYDVVLYIENSAGCIDTSYAVTIFVGERITADFTVDQTSICPGETIQFTGIGDTTLIDAWHFDTDGSRMSHCADDRNPTWGFESITGTMDATMTVIYNGCATTVEKTDLITVNGPIAQLDYLNDCDNKFQIAFADSSHEATTISWDFGDMSAPNTMDNPSHVYAATGDYQVILTASNPSTGCPDSRDTTMVHIRNLEASFELEDNYCQGEMIQFDASMSTDVNATCWKGYTWFPSDSRPITTQDSIIDYAWTGIDTQTLELIVQDINGCQDTLRDTTIVWQVVADGEADPTRLCAPNNVQFTDLSTANGTIDRWEWDFGDMIGTSTLQNPLYTYRTTPTTIDPDTIYTATLIVFDSLNCSDTLPFIIDFYEPVSEILLSDDGVCIGDEVTYSATDFTSEGSFLTYEWFLNGVSIGTNQSGTTTMDEVGDQTLRLEFIEDATGCSGFTEVIINVQDFPDSTFTSTIDGNPINCAGQTVFFTASDNSPGLTYIWDFGEGNGPSSGSQTVPNSFGDADTFTVTLFVETTNGCLASSSAEYTFVKPEGTLTTTDTIICQGDELTFEVIDTSSVTSFVITGGGIDAMTAPVSNTFDIAGTDTVSLITTLIFDGGRRCTNTSILVINVLSGGLELSDPETDICEGEVVTISVINPDPSWDLIWSPGGQTSSSISVSPTEDTRYEVRIDGATGDCSERASKDINVSPVPEEKGDTIYTMVKQPANVLEPFPLAALPVGVDGLDITWSGNLDVTNPLQPLVEDFGPESGTVEYNATVLSDNGRCYSEVFSRIISPAKIPNIFSPNNDMVNDYFQVFLDEAGAEINAEDIVTFQVFNRWGQMVYNNETPDTGWDGRYNNEEQISDVFVYKIVFRMPDGSLSEPCEGDVTLYR